MSIIDKYSSFEAGNCVINSRFKRRKIETIVYGRCLVNPIIQYWRCQLFININIFRDLKLEIALAVPALNDEK